MYLQEVCKESTSLLAFRGVFILFFFFKYVQEQNVLKQNINVNNMCALSVFQQPSKCSALLNHIAKQLNLAAGQGFFLRYF